MPISFLYTSNVPDIEFRQIPGGSLNRFLRLVGTKNRKEWAIISLIFPLFQFNNSINNASGFIATHRYTLSNLYGIFSPLQSFFCHLPTYIYMRIPKSPLKGQKLLLRHITCRHLKRKRERGM